MARSRHAVKISAGANPRFARARSCSIPLLNPGDFAKISSAQPGSLRLELMLQLAHSSGKPIVCRVQRRNLVRVVDAASCALYMKAKRAHLFGWSVSVRSIRRSKLRSTMMFGLSPPDYMQINLTLLT